MLLESALSCSYLLLTCGTCIYTLIKHSYDRYHKLFPHFLCACNGITMIGARSLFVLAYKLFVKEYAFDPAIIEHEEKENEEKCNTLDEILGTLGVTSLIYSFYCHHEYRVLGACVITGLTILDMVKYSRIRTARLQETDNLQTNINSPRAMYTSRTTVHIEVLVGGHFAYLVGNNYALVATYPYFLTVWALTPEGFYQTWTIQRTINDYMMMAYVICMTEALRQISRP